MCLILFSLNKHRDYKLVLAANRDEFFERPTLKSEYWKENPNILGGQDVISGGTWLGLTKTGRFIAITNYRDFTLERKNPRSRGEISKKFLLENIDVISFLTEISSKKHLYNGFNLILSDDQFNTIYHYSNVTDQYQQIEEGFHGLSNHLLDTPWPKITYGINKLKNFVENNSNDPTRIYKILRNEIEADDNNLPDTGISYDLEKKLSPVFISMKGYGTRSSTVMFVDYENRVSFYEVTYNEKKEIIGNQAFDLQLKS